MRIAIYGSKSGVNFICLFHFPLYRVEQKLRYIEKNNCIYKKQLIHITYSK